MKKSASPPKSTAFDYSRFLQQELESRRSGNPSYSLRAFARDLGIPAPQLSEVLRGKRGISPLTAKRIAAKLSLAGEQGDYFLDLVIARHSRSPRARTEAAERLTKRANGQEYQSIALDAFQSITDWAHFAVLEMSKLNGFRGEIPWLARQLDLPESRLREVVERLDRLGLLCRKGNRWKPMLENAWTGKEVPSLAIKQFHERVMQRGIQALYRQPMEQREFTTLMVSLNDKKLPHFKKLMREMVRQLDTEANTSGEKNAVYCFSLQMFRMAKID